MRIGLIHALRLLHQTFGRYPVRRRVHILGRFLTCPFLPLLRHVPPSGRLLEIGAGDGILMRLAIEAGGLTVVGVEPDLRKSLRSWRHPSARLIAGYLDATRGEFESVAMLDVLYRIPPGEWGRLFASIRERVATRGVFLLKELDPDRGWKSRWNRVQEAISDRFLGLTLGSGMHYRRVEEVSGMLRRAGFESVDLVRLDRGYPHAHVLWVARVGGSPETSLTTSPPVLS